MLAFLLWKFLDGWVSTREIIEGAKICAVSAYASNLRHELNGIPVECETTDRIAFYRLRDAFTAVSTALDLVPDARMTPELKRAIYGA